MILAACIASVRLSRGSQDSHIWRKKTSKYSTLSSTPTTRKWSVFGAAIPVILLVAQPLTATPTGLPKDQIGPRLGSSHRKACHSADRSMTRAREPQPAWHRHRHRHRHRHTSTAQAQEDADCRRVFLVQSFSSSAQPFLRENPKASSAQGRRAGAHFSAIPFSTIPMNR